MTVTRPSATVMVVSWIPLSYSEARGFISHYTVAYSPLTSGRKRQALDTMTQTVPGMGTNTTRIEGLDANTDYIVQVSATNGAWTSPLSSPLHVTGDIIKGVRFSNTIKSHCFTANISGANGAVIGIVVVVMIALLVMVTLITVNVALVLKLRRCIL